MVGNSVNLNAPAKGMNALPSCEISCQKFSARPTGQGRTLSKFFNSFRLPVKNNRILRHHITPMKAVI